MREELLKLTKTQLRIIIRQYNKLNQIKRYSKSTKDELISIILQYNILIENSLNNIPKSINLNEFNVNKPVKIKKKRLTKAQQREQAEAEAKELEEAENSRIRAKREADRIAQNKIDEEEFERAKKPVIDKEELISAFKKRIANDNKLKQVRLKRLQKQLGN